jgi:hypothetical protein
MNSAHYDFIITWRCVGGFSRRIILRVDATLVRHSQVKIDIGRIDINGSSDALIGRLLYCDAANVNHLAAEPA